MSEIHRNSPAESGEEHLGFAHENLEGWIPALSTDAEIREALEKAFDYRGDLTITLKRRPENRRIYVRSQDQGTGARGLLRPRDAEGRHGKISVPYSEIAALAFTGRDTAAGKSFAAWVKKYNEKKAAGETNVGIDAEPLD